MSAHENGTLRCCHACVCNPQTTYKPFRCASCACFAVYTYLQQAATATIHTHARLDAGHDTRARIASVLSAVVYEDNACTGAMNCPKVIEHLNVLNALLQQTQVQALHSVYLLRLLLLLPSLVPVLVH